MLHQMEDTDMELIIIFGGIGALIAIKWLHLRHLDRLDSEALDRELRIICKKLDAEHGL